MQILISNNTTKPIYEQIVTQIKNAIMSGELKCGDSLPSMRMLAKDLHISVITTQKAYECIRNKKYYKKIWRFSSREYIIYLALWKYNGFNR